MLQMGYLSRKVGKPALAGKGRSNFECVHY